MHLVDQTLNDIDGYELARRLRAQPETRNAFIAALTAWGRAEDATKAHAAGMDHFILKPASREMLERTLAAVRERMSRERD